MVLAPHVDQGPPFRVRLRPPQDLVGQGGHVPLAEKEEVQSRLQGAFLGPLKVLRVLLDLDPRGVKKEGVP